MKTSRERQFLGLKGNVLTISITELIAGMGVFLTQTFWSAFVVLSLGASVTMLGLLNMVSALFTAVLMVPIGYLSDKIGRKKPVVIGGFIASLGSFLQVLASDWVQLIPGVALASMLQVMWPIRQSIVADQLRPEERVTGFAAFFTIVMFPSAVAPLVAGYIMDQLGLDYGMRLSLLASGILGLIASIIRAKFIKEDPKNLSLSTDRRKDLKGAVTEMLEPLISIKNLQILMLGSCGVMFIFGIIQSYSALYVVKVMGISKTEWGLISAIVGFVSVFIRIPIAKLTIKLGNRKAIILSQFGRAAYPIAFVNSQNLFDLALLGIGYTIAFNIGSPAFQALITDLSPVEMRGRAYGVFGMMWGTLAPISTVLGGAVWDSWGPAWSFYIAGLSGFFSTIFLYTFLKEVK